MRYRLIRYSEADAKVERVIPPLFLFHVFEKKGNAFREINSPELNVDLTILKEASGVFFCYVGDEHPGYTPQTYEYIAIPETHPLFNYKHASRNAPGFAPGRDVAHRQSRHLIELQEFSIKVGQKLQELFTTT